MMSIKLNSHPLLEKKSLFARLLLQWNKSKNNREMPWKGIADPYKIWLSEIILQQTRVDQGLAYYQRFIQNYPSIQQLASAPEQEVFKLWEGLGYYTRCRNLIHTARHVATEKNGHFPDTYQEILQLKGVGSYTAAAIASFAFRLPYAVVDGNVSRVLARVYGIEEPIDTTNGKKLFASLAQELLPVKVPHLFNQAMMDFGATVCKPAQPLCGQCPFKKYCTAFLENKIDQLPVKNKKPVSRKRYFHYVVIRYKGKWAIEQRTQKDIWRQLFQFPLIESPAQLTTTQVISTFCQQYDLDAARVKIIGEPVEFSQQLTHQQIHGSFIEMELKSLSTGLKDLTWVLPEALAHYPFPRIINHYLAQRLSL